MSKKTKKAAKTKSCLQCYEQHKHCDKVGDNKCTNCSKLGRECIERERKKYKRRKKDARSCTNCKEELMKVRLLSYFYGRKNFIFLLGNKG